jgi:ADP-dependent NAD(P)H-hydrate dehydratase
MPPSPPGDVVVTPAVLRSRPLPDHRAVGSKYDRGVALVIGGSAETPGAVLLAGVAALRVGAGKLQLGTAEGTAAGLAVAVPEARVFALAELPGGALDPEAVERLADFAAGADALLVGTGAFDAESTGAVLRRILPHIDDAVLVIDAAAIPALADDAKLLEPLGGRALVMPNHKEMAELLDRSVEDVAGDPASALTEAVDRLGVTVTLRGPETWTSAPGERIYHDEGGSSGLATSGSGDVLAGAITGLAARGADPLTAALWATHLHFTAGARCSARRGSIGYLARELLDELAPALATLAG